MIFLVLVLNYNIVSSSIPASIFIFKFFCLINLSINKDNSKYLNSLRNICFNFRIFLQKFDFLELFLRSNFDEKFEHVSKKRFIIEPRNPKKLRVLHEGLDSKKLPIKWFLSKVPKTKAYIFLQFAFPKCLCPY